MPDGGGRTATAMANPPSVVYVLSPADLDEIRGTYPPLASQLLLNVAKALSAAQCRADDRCGRRQLRPTGRGLSAAPRTARSQRCYWIFSTFVRAA